VHFFVGIPNFLLSTFFGCRSQWPRSLRRRSSATRLLRLWFPIPPGAWMFVCCECCVLSDRGLSDGLITRPEESYRLWRVVVWSRNLETRRLKPATGLCKIQPRWVVMPEKQTDKQTFVGWCINYILLNYFFGWSINYKNMHGMSNVESWIDVCITVLKASIFEGSCINWGLIKYRKRPTAHVEKMVKFIYYFCFRLLRFCGIGIGLNKHEVLIE
jgi:hypothetical protein